MCVCGCAPIENLSVGRAAHSMPGCLQPKKEVGVGQLGSVCGRAGRSQGIPAPK
jgi:hypothetical protein